jgi:hypothetical protein
MPRKRLEGRSLKGEGLAKNTGCAGPERKNRPSRNRPDARHWQRVAGSSPRRGRGLSGEPDTISDGKPVLSGLRDYRPPPTYFFINLHKSLFILQGGVYRKKTIKDATFIYYFSIFFHISLILIFTHPRTCAIIHIHSIFLLVNSIFF